jgi:hypothetical protein
MGEEDRWAKLEEIVRRVVREEVQALGKKGTISFKNGRWEISDTDMRLFREAYPSVDIDKELREAAVWIVTHPVEAPKSKYGAFLATWFKKHQNVASIRAVSRPEPKPALPNLCEYCLSPASGSVNGIRYCREHANDAMDMKPRGRMPGVQAKAVAGGD